MAVTVNSGTEKSGLIPIIINITIPTALNFRVMIRKLKWTPKNAAVENCTPELLFSPGAGCTAGADPPSPGYGATRDEEGSCEYGCHNRRECHECRPFTPKPSKSLIKAGQSRQNFASFTVYFPIQKKCGGLSYRPCRDEYSLFRVPDTPCLATLPPSLKEAV
jgi:hypothetical protein